MHLLLVRKRNVSGRSFYRRYNYYRYRLSRLQKGVTAKIHIRLYNILFCLDEALTLRSRIPANLVRATFYFLMN